ncbi:hypothetical protein CTI12_AA307020 [Artemisia annua]|uniref:Uncharacterized protein n=1 Tax=Artemisia annua TaxID=35608 RepID=A0A2U1MYE2_ARTAN|nr:hypothetical protein CTI12_AA307020 [Artemisia annua]
MGHFYAIPTGSGFHLVSWFMNVHKKLYHHETIKIKIYKGTCDSPDEAKVLIRSEMLEHGHAVVLFEPKKKVISRSGDECVVALTNQRGRKDAEANTKSNSDQTRKAFKNMLEDLKQWAYSRSFGLGTRIPWDEDFLVESFSNSTIYMAYYRKVPESTGNLKTLKEAIEEFSADATRFSLANAGGGTDIKQLMMRFCG